MKLSIINRNVISSKCIVVCLFIFVMLFQDLVYANPDIVKSDSKDKQTLSTATNKSKNLNSAPSPSDIRENSILKGAFGGAGVSTNDLSASYNVGLLATNMYPDKVNSGIVFSLSSNYNSNNNSNFWGIGTGFGLNIPTLTFDNWIETCQGNCDKGKPYNPDAPIQSKGADGFPKNIYYSSSGANIVFKQQSGATNTEAVYVPALISNTNYVYKIKASLSNGVYTFEVDQLTNKNNYTVFTFNGSKNTDLKKPDGGELIAFRSVTYNNSVLPVKVDYQNSADITQGIMVFGSDNGTTDNAHNIKLDNIYPNYEMFNQIVPKDPVHISPIGCFVYNGKHEVTYEGGSGTGIMNGFGPRGSYKYYYYDSLPKDSTFYNGHNTITLSFNNCPQQSLDFSKYTYSSVASTFKEASTVIKQIRGINLNNKTITTVLDLTNYDMTIDNLLSEGGLSFNYPDGMDYCSGPSGCSWNNNYVDYTVLANTTSTLKNALSKLNAISWKGAKGADIQNITLTYNQKFATLANHISHVGQSYYGLTNSNKPVPLLASVSGTSSISPVTRVSFEYDTAKYNSFYTISSMVNLGNDTPLTQVLQHYASSGTFDGLTKDESGTFAYVKKLTTSGTGILPVSTSYTWGTNGHNIHYMYDQPVQINTSESTVAKTNNLIRSMSNFYATTDGLQSNGKQLSPSDLKAANYSTIIDNGATISIATYNRYGLLTMGLTCPGDYAGETEKCKTTQINYAGIVAKNQDLDDREPIPFELVDSVKNYQGDNQTSEIKPIYDAVGRPQTMATYQGNGGDNNLISVSKFHYSNNESGGYYNVSQNETYSRPFINPDINNISSRIYSTTNYKYKDISIGNHVYSVLDNESANSNGLRYGATVYGYDPQNLRITQTTLCTTPADSPNPGYPQCSLAKPADRYTMQQNIIYDDNEQSITTSSSHPGTGQEVWYVAGTGLVDHSINAGGVKQVNSYDDYGRIKNTVISTLSGKEKEVMVSNTTTNYKIDIINNNLQVTRSDIKGNISLSHYNALGQKDCEMGPDLNTNLDGTVPGLGKYAENKTSYIYNSQGQLQTVNSFAGKNLSCDDPVKEDGHLLSQATFSYDYLGRVIDNVTDIAKFNDREDYQTKTHYTYKDARPSEGALWHRILSFFHMSSATLINTTINVQQSKYGDGAWQDLGTTTVNTDIFNAKSNVIIQLPNTNYPITATTSSIQYNKESSMDPVVVNGSSFGKPDSVTKYDSLGRVMLQIINPNGSQAESMSYVYDDLDRVQQVVANGKTMPYAVYYDDNGFARQQVYTYTDNNVLKHRLTENIYKETCLLPAPYCSDARPSFKIEQLESANLYADSTLSGKTWVPNGKNLVTTGYGYNDYGLSTDSLITDQINQTSIKYMTSYDESNQLRVVLHSRTDESGVISKTDYQYFANGGVWQATVDQGNGRPVTQQNSSNYTYPDLSVSHVIKSDGTPVVGFKSVSTIDPGTGLTINTAFNNITGGAATYDHTTTNHYDNQLRLTNKTIQSNGASKIYENQAYTYCDTTTSTCLYGDLLNQRTYFINKDDPSYVEESYRYDPANSHLSHRVTTLNSQASGGKFNTDEGYGYDDLFRLKHYTCNSTSLDDSQLCAADLFSGDLPAVSRDYTYTANNDIQTMKTVNSKGTIYNHTFNYDKSNPNQLVSVTDGTNAVISLTYDQVMAWVNSYTQSTDSIKRNVKYTYNPEGLVNNINDQNEKDNNININRGIAGINGVKYPSDHLTHKNNLNSQITRQYYGGGLYHDDNPDAQTHTFLGIGGILSPDYYLRLDGSDNSFQEQIKGLNDRVIASAYDLSAQPVLLNNYTAYGHMNSNRVERNGSVQTDEGRKIADGENGAYTIFGSYQSKTAEQYQLLGSRIYMPEIGRFLQHDSVSPFGGGGSNGYMYGSGNPVGFADPSGHYGSMFTSAAYDTYNSNGFATDTVGLWANVILSVIFGVMALAGGIGAIASAGFTLGTIIGVGLGVASAGLQLASASMDVAAYYTNNETLANQAAIVGWVGFGLGIVGGAFDIGSMVYGLARAGRGVEEVDGAVSRAFRKAGQKSETEGPNSQDLVCRVGG